MVVEHPELSVGTIPIEAVMPYVDEVVAEYGQQRAEGVLGLAPRRIHSLREQGSVTPEIADQIVSAAASPMALYDDPVLRRFWFASLPSDTLRLRARETTVERSRKKPKARRLVAA